MLTLDKAIELARANNGTVAAAFYNFQAAHEESLIQKAAFYPTVTPTYTYNSDRALTTALGQQFWSQVEGNDFGITASLLLLDLGERNDALLSARRAEDSQFDTARQVLRETLQSVQQDYFETLRAQELERVQQAEVARAQGVFDQTADQVRLGKLAAKERLQANADLANAKVNDLLAKNVTATSVANLKSLIGLPSDRPLPPLGQYSAPDTSGLPSDLRAVLAEGVKNRPDLLASRLNVASLQYGAKLARRQAGVSMNVNASFSEAWQPDRFENRALTFEMTYPLFDGGRSRATARQADYNVKSAQATLKQAEQDARAAIEADFVQLRVDVDRLSAAEDAYTAAKENYDATDDAYRQGASTIIDVLTADVSLVTAESNRIQAIYDFYIAEGKLKLDTGEPLPGEPADARSMVRP